MCGNGGCKAGWRLPADGRCGSILRTGGCGEDGDGERGSLLRERRVGVGGKDAREERCLSGVRGWVLVSIRGRL
jgi:hypothetical protein